MYFQILWCVSSDFSAHYFLPLASILISANRITAFLFFFKKHRTYANGYITERLLPPMQLLYSVQEKCVY